MRRTRIKICSICRAEDGQAAARAGADAIGLIFHPPSRRNVDVGQAARIVAALPAFVTAVGVFVDALAGRVREVAGAAGLGLVQLHGHEDADYVASLGELPVVKAVKVERETLGETLRVWREAAARLGNLRGVVLETGGTQQAGGTGIANDWAAIRRAMDAGEFEGLPAVIAAGGLTPETVGDVVRAIRPFAVDVSSGVEEAVGRKSVEKIDRFVAAVRAADAG